MLSICCVECFFFIPPTSVFIVGINSFWSKEFLFIQQKKNISVVSIVTLGIKINQLSLTHLVTCHRILDGLRARMNCEIHQKIQRGKRKRYQKWIFDIKSHPFSYRVGCS